MKLFMTMEINSFLLRLSSNEKSQINRIDSHDMMKTVMLDIAIMQINLHAELKAKSITIIVTSLTRKSIQGELSAIGSSRVNQRFKPEKELLTNSDRKLDHSFLPGEP